MMESLRRYTKYWPQKSRRRGGKLLYGLLTLVGLALMGWIFWQTSGGVERQSRPTPQAGASWSRRLLSWRDGPSATNAAPVGPRAPMVTTTAPPAAPVVSTPTQPEPSDRRSGQDQVLAAQLALLLQGISSGPLDGILGSQTRAALRSFQQRERLPVTGALDETVKKRLTLAGPLYTTYVVSSNDLARLQPVSPSWLGKSQQERLDYETVLELVAERSQTHPDFIRRLNPGIDWTRVTPGTVIQVPNAGYATPQTKAAFVRISLSHRTLQAYDANTNLLAHFPCSIARHAVKRPVGELHVTTVAPNPSYRFDPQIFTESEEGRRLGRPLMIPPGPNNPVGTAWIGLDKTGYGIHGTPRPEEVGRTESHGCFRLANWNAEYLVQLVTIGMPVFVEP